MSARQHGFTLVEMVVAIAVSAIVVGFMSLFMVAPVQAYLAQERRTELADSANSALRMLQSDIRNAVPESVRFAAVGGRLAMELLYAEDVVRYRSGAAPEDLDIAGDTTFTALGRFTRVAPATYLDRYLVIGHSINGRDAYTLSNVITPMGMSITIDPEIPGTGEQVVTLGSNVTFAEQSPTRSAYLVREPVSYVCNPATGTLTRFWNYPILPNQPATEAQLLADGASSSLVARDVAACTFQPTPSTAFYGGLIRIRMTFARDGETVQVFDQAQVEHRP